MRRIYAFLAIATVFGLLLWRHSPQRTPARPRFALPPFHARVPSPTPRAADEPTPPVILTGGFLFFEDFEHGLARWAVAGRERGVGWHLLHARTCGGEYTMHVGRDGQAAFTGFPLIATLTLRPPLDLTRARAPFLTYDVKGVASPATALVIQPQCRLESGPWRDLGTAARARYALQFTRFADLRPFVGRRLSLRFRATLAESAPTAGMYLDDVQVIETGR
ncbi:MAG TPA: hypothetical protein V6D47_10620 [Oscillatoriaceae cyanobacterium]